MMLGGSPKVDSRLNKIVSCVEPKSLSDIMQHLGLQYIVKNLKTI